MKKQQPLSREFLLNRGFCCNNGCTNCPYKMKSTKSKENLIEKVVEQIKEDVHCGYYESLEGLLKLITSEDLIEYLPEEDWKQFKHLRNGND